jgi:hypothetical protein
MNLGLGVVLIYRLELVDLLVTSIPTVDSVGDRCSDVRGVGVHLDT